MIRLMSKIIILSSIIVILYKLIYLPPISKILNKFHSPITIDMTVILNGEEVYKNTSLKW